MGMKKLLKALDLVHTETIFGACTGHIFVKDEKKLGIKTGSGLMIMIHADTHRILAIPMHEGVLFARLKSGGKIGTLAFRDQDGQKIRRIEVVNGKMMFVGEAVLFEHSLALSGLLEDLQFLNVADASIQVGEGWFELLSSTVLQGISTAPGSCYGTIRGLHEAAATGTLQGYTDFTKGPRTPNAHEDPAGRQTLA